MESVGWLHESCNLESECRDPSPYKFLNTKPSGFIIKIKIKKGK